MVWLVNIIPPLPRTITITLPEEFEVGGVTFATETWRVEWGNGAENLFTAPGPGTATTTYLLLAGGGIVYQYQAAITMTAETGESLRARFDVAVFDTIWQPVSVAGRGLPDIMRGGREADTLDGGGGADTLDGLGGNDLLLGRAGDDLLIATDGANTLMGGSGDDTLISGTGSDHLIGGQGDDWLGHSGLATDFRGPPYGSGNDTLNGGMGADTLEASWLGAATLRLGQDADPDVVLFYLSPTIPMLNMDKSYWADAPDRIVDFNAAHDILHVENRTLRDVSLVFGAPPAQSEGAAVIYEARTGRLFLDNGDGPGAIHVATILSRPELTAENFVIA